MRLVAEPDALTAVRQQGGVLYVWPKASRCCSAVTYTLETGTSPPAKALRCVYEGDGIEVFATPGLIEPQELHLEVGRRGKLRAFWNGQAGSADLLAQIGIRSRGFRSREDP